ncbi:MAG TPA: ScpA family protein [Roseiarcus sp.]|nr:ScpA family protein [Roseiarcus sp.]
MEADAFRVDLDFAQATGEPAFTVDLDGFEGPLDLLLELARRQRVDLARISILALAEQYLRFVEAARKLRLELAADYLVMAAWLAFLKSRLLLPTPEQPADVDAPALAEGLARRLRALAAIRKAGEYLMSRPRLGRDFFARGEPEPAEAPGRISYHANLYDLLAAYARQAQRHALARVRFKTREVWSLADARQALAGLVGGQCDWTAFEEFLLEACADSQMRPSARASTFAASLELAREGRIEMRQERAFAPLWLRPTGLGSGEERAA